MFSFGKHAFEKDTTILTTLDGRRLQVHLSRAALQALEQRTSPILAEMELYFSCLIRFQVRFREDFDLSGGTKVNDKLCVSFRPVTSARCDLHAAKDGPPLEDFPTSKRSSIVPYWLSIDFYRGEWLGQFGYRSTAA
ncbi:hypothetical protein GALL_181780 [mine drainage metagenome]|uniref:Uncharacterized protein n=1 Tax=mine drainage metagenome TaxID=410659 RepID=A0A1J5SI31_9ZZZZ